MLLLKTHEIKLTRYITGGDWQNGIFVGGTTAECTVQCNVQPATFQQLMNLPEAQRTKAVIAIYTEEQLKTVDIANKASADRVEYSNKTYEVQSVKPWNGHTELSHYEVLATETDHIEANRKP
jgi:hypothetical protein